MSNDPGKDLAALSHSEESVLSAAEVDPATPLSETFRAAVSASIHSYLDTQLPVLAEIGEDLRPIHAMATALLSGGKRLRPAFCFWGYVAAAGLPDETTAWDQWRPLLTVASSLDLLHVSALVHDDVMDGSDLRRGLPAAHRQFAAMHTADDAAGDAEVFGRAGAILLGDLLLMWSVQMVHQAEFDPIALARALPLLEAMRTEVTCGQVLDVMAQSHRLSGSQSQPDDISRAIDEANRVVEYKSARYTVQRPAQFGAALGGGDDQLQQVLAHYGSPLGRAFQFRDDLLGVFGDSSVTGKPSGDDLREGKRTLLIAHTYGQTSAAGRATLDQLFGRSDLDHDGTVRLQEVITESGAKDTVETMINSNLDQALTALDGAELSDPGQIALSVLAEAAVRRSS